MSADGLVYAEAWHLGALVRKSRALFGEDAGVRGPLTKVGWPDEHGWDHFSRLIDRDDAVCFLAFTGGGSVGHLAGSMHRPVRIAELQSMYVSPEHGRRGWGEKLVRRFRLWAVERDALRISVTAYAGNGGAIRFYERAGFRSRTISLEAEP